MQCCASSDPLIHRARAIAAQTLRPWSPLLRSLGRSAERIWNFDVDRQRRYGFAAIHLDLNLVRIERDVPADHGENFLAQNAEQVRLMALVALVRQQDLQPFPRNGRGAAAKPVKEVHAAFRPNSLLKIPRLSLGTCIGMVSPL